MLKLAGLLERERKKEQELNERELRERRERKRETAVDLRRKKGFRRHNDADADADADTDADVCDVFVLRPFFGARLGFASGATARWRHRRSVFESRPTVVEASTCYPFPAQKLQNIGD